MKKEEEKAHTKTAPVYAVKNILGFSIYKFVFGIWLIQRIDHIYVKKVVRFSVNLAMETFFMIRIFETFDFIKRRCFLY